MLVCPVCCAAVSQVNVLHVAGRVTRGNPTPPAHFMCDGCCIQMYQRQSHWQPCETCQQILHSYSRIEGYLDFSDVPDVGGDHDPQNHSLVVLDAGRDMLGIQNSLTNRILTHVTLRRLNPAENAAAAATAAATAAFTDQQHNDVEMEPQVQVAPAPAPPLPRTLAPAPQAARDGQIQLDHEGLNAVMEQLRRAAQENAQLQAENSGLMARERALREAEAEALAQTDANAAEARQTVIRETERQQLHEQQQEQEQQERLQRSRFAAEAAAEEEAEDARILAREREVIRLRREASIMEEERMLRERMQQNEEEDRFLKLAREEAAERSARSDLSLQMSQMTIASVRARFSNTRRNAGGSSSINNDNDRVGPNTVRMTNRLFQP